MKYNSCFILNLLICYYVLQKKPDWSKGKPGDQKVKEEEVEA